MSMFIKCAYMCWTGHVWLWQSNLWNTDSNWEWTDKQSTIHCSIWYNSPFQMKESLAGRTASMDFSVQGRTVWLFWESKHVKISPCCFTMCSGRDAECKSSLSLVDVITDLWLLSWMFIEMLIPWLFTKNLPLNDLISHKDQFDWCVKTILLQWWDYDLWGYKT